MNEEHKKRGFASSKTLMTAAICALFLGGGSVMAHAAEAPVVQEQQQTMNVTIKVLDPTGEPIIGANVIQKGTANGSITDFNGVAKLDAPRNASLLISFVGYKTQEVKVTQSLMSVTLKEDSEILSEVVVVGYGTQKKENLTGAVASVDVSKSLTGRQIPDVGRGLQGTTPGLSVVIPNGEIGSDPTMKIRGQIGSIQGSSNPLILLDNVEIPSIQMINPEDIESISVLKDAAASSIYGAKAAFGVVLITSKKGANTDKVTVDYSGNFSWQNISKDFEMAGVDGVRYRVDAMKRAGTNLAGAFWYVTPEHLEKVEAWNSKYAGKLGTDDPFVFGRDWYVDANNRKFSMRFFDPYDYMIREWAPSMTHNVTISGKSGKTTFNVGLGYLDQNGLMKLAKNDDFRRYNGSIRLSTELNKHVTLRTSAIYSKRNKRYAYATNSTTADPWLYMYRWDAFYPMGYDEHGNEMRSPASEIHQANTANKENNYLNFSIGATVKLTKDWNVNFDYTFAGEDEVWKKNGTKFTAGDTWTSPVARYDANGNRVYVDNTGQVVPEGAPGAIPAFDLNYRQYTSDGANPDHIRREVENAKRHTLNITTDYNWQINDDNNLKVLLGMNKSDWESEDSWSQITNLTDIVNLSWDKTAGTQTSSGNMYWDSQLGFFGRLNYNLMDRYLLEANLRYDGTSKFPSHLQWRWFPSFSAGWRLSEEPFMEWSKPVLSSFKFRGSWGTIGDQTVANTLYVPTISQSQQSWLDPSGNKIMGTGTPAAVDTNITWQDITTIDFGFDARFFNGDLGITFDWFQRDTENMIVPAEGAALTYGTGAPKGNHGSFRTRGWEVALDYNHRFENGLALNAMFTLSDATTEVTAYGSTKAVGDWYVGKTYGEIWGYRTDRLYQKEDFVYNGDQIAQVWAKDGKYVADFVPGEPSPVAGAKQMNKLADPNGIYQDYFESGTFHFGPGDPKFKDLNGDGDIRPGSNEIDNHGDREVIGNSTPRYEWGFRLGAEWHGFDASIFFQGVGSRKIWGSGFLAIPGYNTGDGAMPQAIAGDYWREDNTDAFWPAAQNMGGSNSGYGFQVQDRYLLDMSYWRIKNITVGYTLPAHLTKKAWINKARFYVACENFFTFDNLRDLPIDPEVISGVSMFNNGNYNSGRTGVGTPAMKNVSVGIQLNF